MCALSSVSGDTELIVFGRLGVLTRPLPTVIAAAGTLAALALTRWAEAVATLTRSTPDFCVIAGVERFRALADTALVIAPLAAGVNLLNPADRCFSGTLELVTRLAEAVTRPTLDFCAVAGVVRFRALALTAPLAAGANLLLPPADRSFFGILELVTRLAEANTRPTLDFCAVAGVPRFRALADTALMLAAGANLLLPRADR